MENRAEADGGRNRFSCGHLADLALFDVAFALTARDCQFLRFAGV